MKSRTAGSALNSARSVECSHRGTAEALLTVIPMSRNRLAGSVCRRQRPDLTFSAVVCFAALVQIGHPPGTAAEGAGAGRDHGHGIGEPLHPGAVPAEVQP